MPSEYKITVKTLLTQSEKLKISIVKQVLLEEEKKMERKSSQHKACRAAKDSTQGQPRGKGSGRRRGRGRGGSGYRNFCYSCGDENHIARNCPKIAEVEQEKKEKSEEKTKLAVSLYCH